MNNQDQQPQFTLHIQQQTQAEDSFYVVSLSKS